MAASVNNLASAFSTPRISLPPSPATSTTHLRPTPPISGHPLRPPPAISASWNPHSALPRLRFSSLLSLYGPPGPPPSAAPRRALPTKLPSSATLSYLAGNTVLTTSSGELSRGKKIVLFGVPAAFAPSRRHPLRFTAEEFVRGAGEMRRRGADVVACVSVNDVFVMRAWGERIGAFEPSDGGDGVMMMCDVDAGMARAMGCAADFSGGSEGFGLRSENYCVVADDGVVKALFGEENGAGFDDVVREISG